MTDGDPAAVEVRMMSRNDKTTTGRVGIARPLTTFLVFTILGPAIGGAITLVFAMIAMSLGPDGPFFQGGMEEFQKAIPLFAKLSYLAGSLQATFVAVVALLSTILRWSDRVSFLAVVIASVIAGVVFVMVVDPRAYAVAFFISAGVHVGAGIGCWLIAQGILRLFGKALIPKGS